ncbi:putative PurR-regulated permease PerM [Acinetobacter bereziniae]|nr:putative PurR-regulated permease PerM [Acinetobacter bereziniae]
MYITLVIVYLAIIFMVWQMGKLNKQNITLIERTNHQEHLIQSQENHLKQTLQIMQDLAKKMHVQQEVLDNSSNRLTQVEFQNAELIKILQQSKQP